MFTITTTIIGMAIAAVGIGWKIFTDGELLIYTLIWINSGMIAGIADVHREESKDRYLMYKWIKEQKCIQETGSSQTHPPRV